MGEVSTVTLVIAVDGPSGSGKSSAAKGVARALGLRYLDTGAMYRAMTWWMLAQGVPVEDAEAVSARATEPVLELGTDVDAPTISVDGVDVSGPIRTREVTNAVSAVSSVPAVRERLVALQRAAIGAGDIVVEGRDIGTVVAPDAELKVWLTASLDERAERRGQPPAEVRERDERDRNRDHSPMVAADDAVEVDTTGLSIDDVVARLVALVRR
jgi:CMP/dCMP kinase